MDILTRLFRSGWRSIRAAAMGVLGVAATAGASAGGNSAPAGGAGAGSPAPPYYREIAAGAYRVRIDSRGQILEIDVPEETGWGRPDEPAQEAQLFASLKEIVSPGQMSASVLAMKAKQFDDGLYAAVELAAQSGAGSFGGKTGLLKALSAALARQPAALQGDAVEVALAGARLGGAAPDLPPPWRSRVDRITREFLENDLRSKPIGFYTWSDDLKTIFQQDRMLQTPLEESPSLDVLARALHDDPASRQVYEVYLQLVARLTNPLVDLDLRPALSRLDSGGSGRPDKEVCFFPPSRSHETDLVKKLYGNTPIPDGFKLCDELIRRIQDGRIDLKPRPESGWYDYQTWALEPLVIPERMPEAAHLKSSDTYRKHLLDLFRGLLTLTRETHVKQLEAPMAGAAMRMPDTTIVVTVRPELAAEPLPSYYQRRAESYRFVHQLLDAVFGAAALADRHRLTAAGPVSLPLGQELEEMEALFRGASILVSRQMGMAPESLPGTSAGPDAEAAVRRYTDWAAAAGADPDVGQDPRCMVPVYFDVMRRTTRVWVVLGWSRRNAILSFAQTPDFQVLDARGKPARNARVRVDFEGATFPLIYPVMAEVDVKEILDRDQFRRLCDRYVTRKEILAHLK